MTQIRRPKEQGRWKNLSLPSKLLILVPIVIVLRLSLWLSSDQPSTTSHQNQDAGLKTSKSHQNQGGGLKASKSHQNQDVGLKTSKYHQNQDVEVKIPKAHQNQDVEVKMPKTHQDLDVGVKMPEPKSKDNTERPKVTYTAVADTESGHDVLRYADMEEGDVLRYAAMEEGPDGSMRPLTIYRWAYLMAHEDSSYAQDLALNLTTILKACPFDGFRFETKGTTPENSKSKQFEFVLFKDLNLYDRTSIAQPLSFEQYLNACEGMGCVFKVDSSLLVAPKQLGNTADIYGHLAAFVRGASQEQIVGIWRLVAQTFLERLNYVNRPMPVWFSTAGTNIPWLHFQFDTRPKYYHYIPFKKEK